MTKLRVAILVLGMFLSGAASAALITFDTATGGPNNYTDQGVTFSNFNVPGATTISSFANTPNGTRGILISRLLNIGSVNNAMRANIAGGASTVSIDLGDFGADPDRIFLSAFDSFNNLLATTTFDLAAGVGGMHTLSLSAANIAYATFGLTGSVGLGNIYADNFAYGNAVPEPKSVALILLALFAMAMARRRRTML